MDAPCGILIVGILFFCAPRYALCALRFGWVGDEILVETLGLSLGLFSGRMGFFVFRL